MCPACSHDGGDVLNKRDSATTDLRDGTAAILFDPIGAGLIDLHRAGAVGAFAPYVQEYWSVHWDLRERPPYVTTLLPAPCVNVTFKSGRSRVSGVSPERFTEHIDGRGSVFGVRFRPGAFRGLLGRSVAGITGRFLPLSEVFGDVAAAWEYRVLSAADVRERAAIFEDLLGAARLPALDAQARFVRDVVDSIVADRGLLRVDQVARRHDCTVRRLERLFGEYVGVSPKWTVRRYRMQEAAARAVATEFDGWAALAHDLGYADQAHFVRDFTACTGVNPTSYRRTSTGASAS